MTSPITTMNLREMLIQDIPNIHNLNSFAEVDKFNTLGIPQSILDTENTILPILQEQNKTPRRRFDYVIQNAQFDFIGMIGLIIGKPKYKSAEIWYKIQPSLWNKGYATASVKLILKFCFTELNLHRVCAGCATENLASIQVLEKNDFVREGLHRKILPIRNAWVDNYEYAILEEDYFKNKLHESRT